MKAWTDYPIMALGDISGQEAPVRQCDVLLYDGDKRCRVHVNGVIEWIKSGYLYSKSGRFGDVPCLTKKHLESLLDPGPVND